MPTPTLTSACEDASGSISKPSSAKYLRYFIMNSLLPVRFLAGARPPDLEVLQLFVSEAPTDLNSRGREKLRREEWLISAILREISQLRIPTIAQSARPGASSIVSGAPAAKFPGPRPS